jgi:hypothetical protein
VATLPNPQEDLERLLVPAPELIGKRPTLSEVHAAAEREADAVANVRHGRAHPLHFDYLRHARDLVRAQADRLGDALQLDAEETLAGWARGYLDSVRERGQRDSPPSPAPFGGPHSDVLRAYGEAGAQAASGAKRQVAHVCLGVAPAHPVVVTLRRSSGNERLDAIAVASFQQAAGARAVAPDVRPGLACYVVGVSAYRVPPLPTLGFGWKNGRPELIHPLKRVDQIIVELESLDYGPRAGPPSLLRRPN